MPKIKFHKIYFHSIDANENRSEQNVHSHHGEIYIVLSVVRSEYI